MYLLDTNALSELIKKRPRPRFVDRLRRHPADALFTSTICVMELRYGSSRRADRDAFWERIQGEILPRVGILALGLREALLAGDVLAELSLRGKRIAPEDLLIGATALAHGYAVVTDNVRHFARIPNLQLENWLA
jgi:tRNA(fMet)-specific endonuclease VapC